jgi:hypothetical protein
MSDSDICTTVLLGLWAFITIVLNQNTQFCEQFMKESLSTFEDCTKNVHRISLKTDRVTEQMNQNVELYICTFFNYSQNNWANLLLMTELVIMSQVCNEIDAQLIIFKYKKNIMKKKKKSFIWKQEGKCFSLKVLFSN